MNNILEVKNLSKNFDGIKAVNNCSFEITQGQVIALIGPNGSGKTTVFNLISGVLKSTSGEILLFNKSIEKLQVHEIANLGISRLFQQSKLFTNMTIKENLKLAINQDNFNFWSLCPNNTIVDKKIYDALKKFNLEKYINYQTKNLSYGQKRLVEICRTYLKPHKLLLLDEPIAGVAPHLREIISDFLNDLRDIGETTLIIEHDMDFVAKLADKVIVMDAGKVIANGKPGEVLGLKEVVTAYFGSG